MQRQLELSACPSLTQRAFKGSTRESSLKSFNRNNLDQDANHQSKLNNLANIYGTHSMQRDLSYKKGKKDIPLPRDIKDSFKAKEMSLKYVKVTGVQITSRPLTRVFFPENTISLKVQPINISYKMQAHKPVKKEFQSFTSEKKTYMNTMEIEKQQNINLFKVFCKVKDAISNYKESETILIKENYYLKKEIAKLRNQLKHKV